MLFCDIDEWLERTAEPVEVTPQIAGHRS